MQTSLNPGHDYQHAKEVEKHAIEIAKELEYTDLELVSLASWWHDVYKATEKQLDIFGAIFEGNRASKLTREELSGKLDDIRLNELLFAIEMHQNYLWQLINRGRMPKLIQILIEADGIDRLRKREEVDSTELGEVYRFVRMIWYKLADKVLASIVMSKYGKDNLREYTK
jgi:HD superfamily phosphohydrolase YqeK